jgi:hypothetical protein
MPSQQRTFQRRPGQGSPLALRRLSGCLSYLGTARYHDRLAGPKMWPPGLPIPHGYWPYKQSERTLKASSGEESLTSRR